MQEESDFLRGQMTALYDQIEKLKSENESLDDKLQEQMCLVGSLLEENAKLIAELKEASLTICALRAEIDEYQAEREAMMKQEPVDSIFEQWWQSQPSYKASEKEASKKAFLVGINLSQVYCSPLPAQQIPEGLHKWYVKLTNQDQVFDTIDADNIDHVGYLCTNEMLNELEAMLYASHPKGDV